MRRLTRLRPYAPVMVGAGILLLVMDGVALMLRWLGVEKWTALYLAMLGVIVALSWWVQHHLDKHPTGDE